MPFRALHIDASLLGGFVYVASGKLELGLDRRVSCSELTCQRPTHGAGFKTTRVPNVNCGAVALCVYL